MVRINKVYTKKGDKGETRLAGGKKVPKDHPRVEAYGTVDELNSLIGVARGFVRGLPDEEHQGKFDAILQEIQQKLFDLGSHLATDPESAKGGTPFLTEKNVQWLEEVIDTMNEELEPLKSFVLPGGSPLPASLHQCRAVCRRAEREILRLSRQSPVDPIVIPFINRLSDALFVFARWTVHTLGEEELLWEPGRNEIPDWRWKKGEAD